MSAAEFIKQVLGHFTGVSDPENYPIYVTKWLIAFVGVYISLRLHAKKRNPESENTPPQFSFMFLIRDNLKRLGITMALIYAFLRFPDLWIMQFPLMAQLPELQFALPLVVGLALDKIAQWLKEKNWLGLAETKVRQEYKEEQKLENRVDYLEQKQNL